MQSHDTGSYKESNLRGLDVHLRTPASSEATEDEDNYFTLGQDHEEPLDLDISPLGLTNSIKTISSHQDYKDELVLQPTVYRNGQTDVYAQLNAQPDWRNEPEFPQVPGSPVRDPESISKSPLGLSSTVSYNTLEKSLRSLTLTSIQGSSSSNLTVGRFESENEGEQESEHENMFMNHESTPHLGHDLVKERRALRERTGQFAFYDYACRYWADHLRLSEFSESADFETINFLSWFLQPSREEGTYVSWQQMYHRDIIYYCPGRPPLHYAIDFKIDNLVSLVLPPPDEIYMLSCGVSALHVAARAGAISTVGKLLDLGASVHYRSAQDPLKMTSLMTAMHFAAEGGHADVLQLLLEHGASPDVRNESGSTPFMRAARSGSLQALKVLYDAGVNIDAHKKGFTPLFEAVAHCRPRVACQLLHWGADPSIKNTYGESALTFLRRAHNRSFLDERGTKPRPKEDKYSSLVNFYKSEDDFLREIDALRARAAPPSEYLYLMKGLKRQYSLIKQIEKDTRPGTEREKDYRFPLDVSPTMSPILPFQIEN
jgi:hypothetical protein